jgi:hypothetical protein
MSRLTCLLMFAVACGGTPEETPQGEKLLDTGWFVDTDAPSNCAHQLVLTEPAANDSAWYWLDPLTVYVETEDQAAYDVQLVNNVDVSVPSKVVWSENLSFTVTPLTGSLEANMDYRLIVTDCAAVHEVPFRTSAFGEPFVNGPTALIGHTYNLDLVNANWVEPGGLGALLALYFTTPVLMGVQYADFETLDFLAAPGLVSPFGGLIQDITMSSWDFPATDFHDAPYFSAQTNEVVFEYEGEEVPVADFNFSGTISGDMRSIGGGVITGTADTRNMGAFVGAPGDEDAMCETASSLGVACIPCNDGQPYCLAMEVRDVDGEWVEGLELQP